VGTFNIFNGHYPVFLGNHAVFALITGRPVRIRLRTPPSSLRKPHVSDATPNRAFLRGFSATPFPDFGLYERSRILGVVFGPLSPHLEIPFPAVGRTVYVKANLFEVEITDPDIPISSGIRKPTE